MVEVIAEVDKQGRITILMRGFRGQTCVENAQTLLALLKGKGVEVSVDAVQYTDEYYVEEGVNVESSGR